MHALRDWVEIQDLFTACNMTLLSKIFYHNNFDVYILVKTALQQCHIAINIAENNLQ